MESMSRKNTGLRSLIAHRLPHQLDPVANEGLDASALRIGSAPQRAAQTFTEETLAPARSAIALGVDRLSVAFENVSAAESAARDPELARAAAHLTRSQIAAPAGRALPRAFEPVHSAPPATAHIRLVQD